MNDNGKGTVLPKWLKQANIVMSSKNYQRYLSKQRKGIRIYEIREIMENKTKQTTKGNEKMIKIFLV